VENHESSGRILGPLQHLRVLQLQKMPIKYNKNRFPVAPQKGKCRGCHGDVPKGRLTWCSKSCNDKFEPRRVLYFVQQRDKGICQICGLDTIEAEKKWWAAKPNQSGNWWEAHQRWSREKPVVNYDHIIPFSEGGLTVLENMRTLCEPCHKARTKKWHKERSARSG
jgi:HNH endonuclease